MRVISGSLGGQNFESPHGHRTHPMSDKIRGAIFGVLGDISGCSVLDAFSGSGALAIEAISRGSSSAVAVEVDAGAHAIIVKNIQKLGIEKKVKVVRAFVNAWSTRHQDQLFDIIFADPPYDNIPYRDLKFLARHLKPTGTLVLSWPGKADVYYIPELIEVQIKKYGDAQLIFYKYA
ncbi:MAG: RsmD family RNA methyltransferase [Candidatus Saccharibacteria bacterium]